MSARENGGDRPAVRPLRSPAAPAPVAGGWGRLFRRPRLLAEVRFALGAALVMAVAGATVAFAMPPIRLLASDGPAARLFVQGSVGFGLGWWGGLFWSVALAFHARRFRPAPPLDAMMRAVWIAAALAAAVALALRAGGASVLLSIGAGVVAATVGARTVVGRAAREARP